MLAALHFSKELGYPVHPDVLQPYRKWYTFDFKPVREKISELLFLMQADKKNREADAYRLVLLREYEKPIVEKITDKNAVSRAWEWLLEQHA
jgi:3-dehydroquinate synthetase